MKVLFVALVSLASLNANDDVYVCENGAWTFLYTRGWDGGQD